MQEERAISALLLIRDLILELKLKATVKHQTGGKDCCSHLLRKKVILLPAPTKRKETKRRKEPRVEFLKTAVYTFVLSMHMYYKNFKKFFSWKVARILRKGERLNIYSKNFQDRNAIPKVYFHLLILYHNKLNIYLYY